MSEPFIGEIRIFPFPFAPSGWAMCNGQLLLVAQAAVLFSVIGTTYGGDGVHNFALPDLEANVPLGVTALRNVVSPPLGGGLSTYAQGQFGGEQTHTLLDSESPSHSHNLNADGDTGVSPTPAGFVFRRGQIPGSTPIAVAPYSSQAPDVTMSPLALGITGGGQPHNNMMPYLTLNFCIALQGIFPQRG
jgi:microcystin-dependent protein